MTEIDISQEDIQMPNKYIKRSSTSLIIKKMQIKSKTYHSTHIRMDKTTTTKRLTIPSDIENVGKWNPNTLLVEV